MCTCIKLWLSQTDTLITQISQVIQEICDIKGNKILGSNNKYHKLEKPPDTAGPIVQREHNRCPKGDTDETGVPDDDETNDNKLSPPISVRADCLATTTE